MEIFIDINEGNLGFENRTFIWRPITNLRKRFVNVQFFL